MDVLIPLYQACETLRSGSDRIPVLYDGCGSHEHEETYLRLNTDGHGANFDLQIGAGGASVLAKPALHYARRDTDEDAPRINAEDYARRGREVATSLYFGYPLEYLAAWINEDRKQAEIMRAIHSVLSLNILTKLPQWVRYDLFLLLESEAMKQVFAERFLSRDSDRDKAVSLSPIVKDALRQSGDNITNPLISTIMQEAMQAPPVYNGCGQVFLDQAALRMEMFHKIIQDQ